MVEDYVVEVTVDPVADDGWKKLRDVLDVIPGSILLEDRHEPMFIFTTQARSTAKAIAFAEKTFAKAGVRVRWGRALRSTTDRDLPGVAAG